MLAYRHAYHAGNHADVLKHLILVQVLRHMAAKDKPYRLIDTHAGGGAYALASPEAQKKGEYLNGVARLWGRKDLPPATAEYMNLVRRFQPGGGAALTHYPGSPWIGRRLLRDHDEHRLYELHPTDHRLLDSQMEGELGVKLFKADGFASLKSQLPPPQRRGVVLMDPSYELANDYNLAFATVREALERFAQAVIVLWYPLVSRFECTQFVRRLPNLGPKSWVNAQMTVQPLDDQGFGLAGSGVLVINPPYTLAQTLRDELPFLTETLSQFDGPGAHFKIDERAV